MTIHKTIKAAALLPLMALMLVARIGLAEISLPYNNSGTVDAVDWDERVIYVDDSGYQIAADIVAYSAGGQPIAYTRIKEGQAVGFNTRKSPAGGFAIVEIWVLR